MAKPVRASYASEHRKAMVKTLQSIGGGGNTNVILRADNYEQACLIRKRLGKPHRTEEEMRAG